MKKTLENICHNEEKFGKYLSQDLADDRDCDDRDQNMIICHQNHDYDDLVSQMTTFIQPAREAREPEGRARFAR